MSFLRPLAIAVVVCAVSRSSAEAQPFRWMAFGDSITEAWSDWESPQGGYPGRLANDFGCNLSNCEVYNAGKSSEATAGGVTRIDQVFNNNGPFDVALIMEGTNDIWGNPQISTGTILFNLNAMANKAEARGTEAVIASIIWLHPGGARGTNRDDDVQDLRNQILSSANSNTRTFADPWSRLCPTGNDQHGHNQGACFWSLTHEHYWLHKGYAEDPPLPPGQPDVVGHPNSTGFRMIADEFKAVISAIPIPGLATPNTPSGDTSDTTPTLTWTRESPTRASWYQVRVNGPSSTPFQTWVKASDVCSGNSCSTSVIFPLASDNYSWQVMSRNLRGRTGWSTAQPFSVGLTPVFTDGFESGNTSAWSSISP